MRRVAFVCLAATVSGCASLRAAEPGTLPRTLGEASSGFGYIPLDGLAINEHPAYQTCFVPGVAGADGSYRTPRPVLEDLPDISVRFAVATVDGSGAMSFGPAKMTVEGGTYRAVLDYVNVDVIPARFFIRKFVRSGGDALGPRGILEPLLEGESVSGYDARIRPQFDTDTLIERQFRAQKYDLVTIPVYVGIGLRLTADIRARKGNIALTSLAGIAAEAQAKALSGTLTVQTLGVSGGSVATALPLPSKLDQTTVENGILALGSSRAIIYRSDGTTSDVRRTPRIVGLYSPFGSDPRLINSVYAELSRERLTWDRTCAPNSPIQPVQAQ
jgi:hypothetical protein